MATLSPRYYHHLRYGQNGIIAELLLRNYNTNENPAGMPATPFTVTSVKVFRLRVVLACRHGSSRSSESTASARATTKIASIATAFRTFALKAWSTKGAPLSELAEPINYEQLALAELEAARQSSSAEKRNAHLNQAAVFAAKDEAARRDARVIR